MPIARSLSKMQATVITLRTAAEELVAIIERTEAEDRHETADALAQIAVRLGDVEDEITIARERERQMKKRF